MDEGTYEFVILEVGNNFLSVSSGTRLEGIDTVRLGLLQLRFDRLHVTLYPRLILHKLSGGDVAYLEIGQEALLVEPGRLKTERVDDVVDSDHAVLNGILSFLRGRVGTWTVRSVKR